MKKYLILAIGFLITFFGIIYITTFLPPSWLITLDNAGILFGYFLTCVSVVGAVYAFMQRYEIKRFFRRNEFAGRGEELIVPEENIRAMVIPVSHRQQPEWILRHLKPEKVVFLFTERSRGIVRQLIQDFSEQINFPIKDQLLEEETYCLQDAFDPDNTFDLVKKFIGKLTDDGIDPQNIFVDTTGGTVPMSIGSLQAAEAQGVSSIYVIGQPDGVIKDPRQRHHGYPIFLSDKTN